MGGCASKPKELVDGSAGTPLRSDKPQLEVTPQSTTNGGESQIEKPEQVVAKEAQTSSSKAVSAESELPKTKDGVEATNKNNEDKVEASTEQPVKEAEAAEQKLNDVPPSKEEVKSDAPLASI